MKGCRHPIMIVISKFMAGDTAMNMVSRTCRIKNQRS